jgi:hypothetical protein
VTHSSALKKLYNPASHFRVSAENSFFAALCSVFRVFRVFETSLFTPLFVSRGDRFFECWFLKKPTLIVDSLSESRLKSARFLVEKSSEAMTSYEAMKIIKINH